MKLQPKLKLLDCFCQAIRLKNYSCSTEKACVYRRRCFILFYDKWQPKTMRGPETEKFLSNLAIERNVSASIKNQALCALLFLYREILGAELDFPINTVRAKRPKLLPTVLKWSEVQCIIGVMSGEYRTMTKLLYGSGLRLTPAPHKCATQVQVWSVFVCASKILISGNTSSSFVTERGPKIALQYYLMLLSKNCTANFAVSSCFTKTIWLTVSVEYRFLLHWRLNIPARNWS